MPGLNRNEGPDFGWSVLLPDQAIPRTISEGRAEFRENNKTLLWDEFSLSLGQ